MASNEPFKKKKVEYNVDQSTVDKILKKRFGTEKKPKKFTWEGLYNFTAVLDPNPFSQRKLTTIKLITIKDQLKGRKLKGKN